MDEPVFDKIHAARLTYLADQLETAEQLLVGEFNFDIIYEKNLCGSTGCALGEAALIWPEIFRDSRSYYSTSVVWFGLRSNEIFHLFFPYEQIPSLFGGKTLGCGATRYDVAANIRAFLAIKGAKVVKE
jgi:hypothetical protein